MSGQIFYLFIELFSCQVRVLHIFWILALYQAWNLQVFSVCGLFFIQFLAVCFTEDISSSLAGACCQLFTTWASPQGAHNIADCCTEANKSERLTKQVFFTTQSSKWHLVFAVFYSLEASYQVHPTLRRKGLYKGMKPRRQGSGTILEAAFTRYADGYHKYYLHFQYLRFFLFYLSGIATRC